MGLEGIVLRTLLESDAHKPRRRAGLAASIVVHTVLIGGALAATASARSREGQDQAPRPPIIHYQRRELPASRLSRSESSRRSDGTTTTRQLPVDVGRTITYLPDSLFRSRIDVDLGQRVGVDTGSVLCLVPCAPANGVDSGGPLGGAPATVATVDRGAALVSPPRPRYPEQLRATGVTGRVIVRLVVDTLGRVEPATIIIRESSHDLFAQSVRAILPALRFVPAEAGGRKVRMVVDLPFEFRLTE
jgi:periplasmic protein TonB